MGRLLYYPAGAFFVWLFIKAIRTGRRESDLPPGPPTVPLLGNLNIFPKEEAHLKLTEWARVYGGIYSLKMGPGTAVVITDPTIVRDIMDKRSQSTVDRPSIHIADRVTGGMQFGLVRYSDNWRKFRRASQDLLSVNACLRHLSIQRAEASQLLHDCLVDPEQFFIHLKRAPLSVMLSALFGKRAPRFETKDVSDFFEVQHMWESILAPGATPPVDILPFLRFLPKPLAQWKVQCDIIRRFQRTFYFGLLRETEERVVQGRENGCFMEQVLARQEEFGMSRELVGHLGGSLIEGGSDTTSAWLQSLVLALVAFPEAQKKAQDEIDEVVGNDRAPTPEDFPRLPYVQAIIKEVHRWRPVAPLAIPHATIDEINYRSFRIPVGSTIFVNNWGMLHDPEAFERPEDFWPDRWISNEFGTKPGVDNADRRNTIWYGSGRRICAGIHMANDSLMLNTMNLIWAFNFGPETDSQTRQALPVDIFNYTKGLAVRPEPFRCTITPRTPHHAEIIEHEFAAAAAAFKPYEHGLREEDKLFVESQRI